MQVYKGSVCFKCNFTEIIHKYDCCRVTLRRVTEYVKARPLKVYLILKWYMWYKKNWEKLIFPERFFSADPGNPSHKPCSINELKSLVIAVFLIPILAISAVHQKPDFTHFCLTTQTLSECSQWVNMPPFIFFWRRLNRRTFVRLGHEPHPAGQTL